MSTFKVKEELEKSSGNMFNFRKDESIFLKIGFNSIFNKEKNNLEEIEKYLYNFFKKIQESNFPLGHKYVDLNKKYDIHNQNNDDIDFLKICENFYNAILSYKNSTEKAERNYEI